MVGKVAGKVHVLCLVGVMIIDRLPEEIEGSVPRWVCHCATGPAGEGRVRDSRYLWTY